MEKSETIGPVKVYLDGVEVKGVRQITIRPEVEITVAPDICHTCGQPLPNRWHAVSHDCPAIRAMRTRWMR